MSFVILLFYVSVAVQAAVDVGDSDSMKTAPDQQQVEEMMKTINTMQNQLEKVTRELRDVKTQLQDTETGYKTRLERLEEEMNAIKKNQVAAVEVRDSDSRKTAADQHQVEEMIKTIDVMQGVMHSHQDQMEEYRSQITELRDVNTEHEIQIDNIENKIRYVETDYQDRLEECKITLKNEFRDVESGCQNRLNGIEEEINVLKENQGPAPFIGFTATVSYEQIYFNERVDFDVVITNAGGWYNPVFSEFTCPVNGSYIFSVNVMSEYNYRCYGYLMVDGELAVRTLADGRTGVYGHGSNTVTIHCKQGQKVWVQGTSSYESNLYAHSYSTFTGILLHADQ